MPLFEKRFFAAELFYSVLEPAVHFRRFLSSFQLGQKRASVALPGNLRIESLHGVFEVSVIKTEQRFTSRMKPPDRSSGCADITRPDT